jgi:hypothetical protein
MLRNYTAYFVVECNGIDTGNYEDAGFYPAATFAEAMAHIEEFYGSELVVVKHLELMDTSLVHMNPELAKQVIAENFC